MVDLTENTVSRNNCVVVKSACLGIDWILFLAGTCFTTVTKQRISFSRSLHSNGYTRYHILLSLNCWHKVCGPYLSESSCGRPPLIQVSLVPVCFKKKWQKWLPSSKFLLHDYTIKSGSIILRPLLQTIDSNPCNVFISMLSLSKGHAGVAWETSHIKLFFSSPPPQIRVWLVP
jgi:hypothetical protein